MSEYSEWESFYVIVGAAAGALIGLQFVVLTLIAERPPPRVAEGSGAFLTPTIVHFSAALLLSGLLRMPWHTVAPAAALWGITGISGLVYAIVIARRMRKQRAYKPDPDDWVFYAVLPPLPYAALVLAALLSSHHTHEALLVVGSASLVLLFLGIRNAWDSVAYHVFVNLAKRGAEPDEDKRTS